MSPFVFERSTLITAGLVWETAKFDAMTIANNTQRKDLTAVFMLLVYIGIGYLSARQFTVIFFST